MMKYDKLMSPTLLTMAIILFTCFFSACQEDINVGTIDESKYEVSKDIFGYLTDVKGQRNVSLVEFRENGKTDLFLHLTGSASKPVSVKLKYDNAVLEAYNEAHESSYDFFPENLVTFAEGGTVQISAGENKSERVPVSFLSGSSLDPEKSYGIPISIELVSGDVSIGSIGNYIIMVKDITKIPDAAKATGIKIISCQEVNDSDPLNPLNHLCFTLKDTGKPLFDMVILFAANIKYDIQTGGVYLYNNPNVQYLLSNREKYLKPLQDKGIKVVLGILGGGERSGVANLADETAREFAKNLKATADTYLLDGFFFDDEYSAYQTPVPPGFVAPSNAAAARLFFEAKKLMPDKLMCAYVYSRTRSFESIDGIEPGEFVDWGIHDYGGSSDLSWNYPGLQKSGMALYSQEFALNRFTSENNLKRLRNNGYGGHMVFSLNPFRNNFTNRQLPALQMIAKTLFDEELVYNGQPYKKDW